MVPEADIRRLECLVPSIIKVAVPHLSLKETPMNTMAVPSLRAVAIYFLQIHLILTRDSSSKLGDSDPPVNMVGAFSQISLFYD